jgi:hypothetical protein
MNRREFATSLFWLGISIFVVAKALALGVGEFSNPGPGFLLFWSSLTFGILSVVLMIRAILGKEGTRPLSDPFKGLKWGNSLITIVALFVYALFLTRVGFVLMTFGLMVLLFALGRVKLWIGLSGAFVTIMVAYSIFHFALQVQLPRGILGW